jgi:hypothetical protein
VSFLFFHNISFSLKQKGVTFVEKKLDKLESFVTDNDFDIIFNCLGLGNIQFCDDKHMTPHRGQMIRVFIDLIHST